MGGIRTKYTGESQTLTSLYSCGEAACWDMHGFNRLGGNSVSETVVSGMLVAEYIADFCETPESHINISTETIESFMKIEQEKLEKLIHKDGGEDAFELREAMEKIMMDKVGIFRNGKDLQDAVNELEQLLIRSQNITVHRSQSLAANPALVNAYRTQKMIKVALTVAYGALLRTESRGAHAREDYPERNDKQWLNRSITSWKTTEQTLPDIEYETITIDNMELPPGFRGYGKNLNIVHPQSELRQKEVDALKDATNDRFDLQESLMPFRNKLPKKYQGRNERLSERFE